MRCSRCQIVKINCGPCQDKKGGEKVNVNCQDKYPSVAQASQIKLPTAAFTEEGAQCQVIDLSVAQTSSEGGEMPGKHLTWLDYC